MGECKTRAIQTNFGTFRHNETYPGIMQDIQAYLEPCVTLEFLKQWYIQNPITFRTPAYSEPCYPQKAGIFKI